MVRNSVAFHRSPDAVRARAPASSVRDTTCLSGGSEVMAFGRWQGLFGSAQPSSTGEGGRLPWLKPAYKPGAPSGVYDAPTAGFNFTKLRSLPNPAAGGGKGGESRSTVRTRVTL